MKTMYTPSSSVTIPRSVHSPYSVVYTRRKTLVTSPDKSKFYRYGCSTIPGDRQYLLLANKPEMKKTLDYISVPPGVGKTKWAIDYILDNSKAKKEILIYCAPTTILLKQVFMDVKRKFKISGNAKLNISFRGVQEDNDLSPYMGFKDMSEIRPMTYYASVLLDRMGKGSCLFLTHATFLAMKDVFSKGRYHVIFDEAAEMQISPDRMQIDQKSVTLLNNMVSFELFPMLDVEPTYKFSQDVVDRDYKPYFRLRCLDDANKYSGTYKNFADITKNQKLADLIEKASDDQFSVFVREERAKEKNTYYFFDFITPSGVFHDFGKVTLLSAFFEESLMFQILKQTYKLRNVNHLVDERREKSIYEGYKNLEIAYLFDINRPLSKSFLENAVFVKDGKEKLYLSFLKKYVPLICDEMLLDEKDATKVLIDHLTKEPNSRILKLMQRKLKEKDFDCFDSMSTKLKAPANAIQRMVRKDLKRRTNDEDFLVADKPLIIANLGKSIQNKFGNSQYVDLLFPIHKDFEWLRTKSHGLNSFSKRNVFVSMAALNMQPHVLSFYNFLIPDFDTSIMSTHTILQGVTRTRIRKIGNDKKVLLYVFSKKEAEALHRAFRQKPTITKLEATLNNFYMGVKQYYIPEEVKAERAKKSKIKARANSKIKSKEINSNYRKDPEYAQFKATYDKTSYAYKKLDPESTQAKKLRKELDSLNSKLKQRRAELKMRNTE